MYKRFILSLPPYWRSVVLLMLSTFLVTVMQACVRLVSVETEPGMHPFEAAFFRNLFGLFVILPAIIRYRRTVFKTKRPGLQALRGILNAASMLLFFLGISMAPLATVAALSFTSPLFAGAIAFFVLREKVTPGRIAALVIGFSGMLMLVQPGRMEIDLGSIILLVSSFFWALVLIDIKVLSRTDSSITIIVYQLLYLTPMTLAAAIFYWQWPNLEQLLWLALIGGLATMGQILLTEAYRYSDASSLVPLDFLRLIWGALLGYLMFAQVPEIWTWLGGLMIFAGASWVAWEQTRQARIAARSPGTD